MCLVVKKDIKVNFDQNNCATVYKFMLQDSEGNLHSPRYGGQMLLDKEGFYHSDVTGKPEYKEWAHVERGIHVVLDEKGVDAVKERIANMGTQRLADLFAKKRSEKIELPVKMVWAKFTAYADDLIAVGDNEVLPNSPQAVFTKVKFETLLK